MEIWETVVAVCVFVLAVLYLYRKLVRQKGCSCGDGCCSRNPEKK